VDDECSQRERQQLPIVGVFRKAGIVARVYAVISRTVQNGKMVKLFLVGAPASLALS
jgi:hypothetical protein